MARRAMRRAFRGIKENKNTQPPTGCNWFALLFIFILSAIVHYLSRN